MDTTEHVRIGEAKLIQMYRLMVRIRQFEEKLVTMFAEGTMPGLAHLYIGEEAVAVGSCSALREDDYIVSTHRGHGHVIAKGGKTDRMMAELFGRSTGYCKGKGGSMHIADLDLGILGAMSVVAAGIPIAVGAAVSAQMRGTDQVVLSYFGDGASNEGAFHEALNLASVWKAPVIFICENNQYGISVHQSRHQAIVDIADRAVAYGMPGVVADGNDILAVLDTTSEAVGRARAGAGPTLIEYKTYRWRGHYEGDPGRGMRYRTAEEMAEWEARGPIQRFQAWLLANGVATESDLATIRNEISDEIAAAVAYAVNSPFPSPEDGKADVYSDPYAYVVDPQLQREPPIGGQR